jgi:hypothetical protein
LRQFCLGLSRDKDGAQIYQLSGLVPQPCASTSFDICPVSDSEMATFYPQQQEQPQYHPQDHLQYQYYHQDPLQPQYQSQYPQHVLQEKNSGAYVTLDATPVGEKPLLETLQIANHFESLYDASAHILN